MRVQVTISGLIPIRLSGIELNLNLNEDNNVLTYSQSSEG